jgi:hypothetical protein
VKRGPGLFNGFWTTLDGKVIRRIYRSEYGELYRLHRICVMYEKQDAAKRQAA